MVSMRLQPSPVLSSGLLERCGQVAVFFDSDYTRVLPLAYIALRPTVRVNQVRRALSLTQP